MFNLRNFDLNLLTVFEAVYEGGTVGGAATRLSLSQSATSHALARLREVCNDQLFVRAGQRLSPTPVATAMYPTINQALESLRVSLAEASGFDPARSQRHFRISIPHPMGPFYALTLRAAAKSVAPSVAVRFDTASLPIDLEESLRDGVTDIAVDWLPATLDPFVNQKLFDDRLVLIARTGHPRIGPGAPCIEDVRREEFVTLHRRRALEHLPGPVARLYNLGLQEVVHVSELLEVPTVVASTELLGVFASSMGRVMRESLGLQVLPLPIELPALPIYMTWHEARRNDLGHKWLRDMVAAELSRSARK
jgi:DNA-binding transcriptional LysR family regulator